MAKNPLFGRASTVGPRINHRLGRTYDQEGSTLYQQGLGSHTFPRSLVVASLFWLVLSLCFILSHWFLIDYCLSLHIGCLTTMSIYLWALFATLHGCPSEPRRNLVAGSEGTIWSRCLSLGFVATLILYIHDINGYTCSIVFLPTLVKRYC